MWGRNDKEPVEPDPELISRMRDEIRDELRQLDMKDLLLESATNARIAVRVLYRVQEPRIRRLEQRDMVTRGVLVFVAVTLPVLVALFEFIGNMGA